MTSKRPDKEKERPLPAETGGRLGQTMFSGVGLLGGSATCSLIGGIVGFAIGPVGVLAGAIPGAIIGGLVGGTVGDKIGKEVDRRLMLTIGLMMVSRENDQEVQKSEAVGQASQPREESRDVEFIAHLQQDTLQDYEGDTMPDNAVKEKDDPTVVKRVVVQIERH